MLNLPAIDRRTISYLPVSANSTFEIRQASGRVRYMSDGIAFIIARRVLDYCGLGEGRGFMTRAPLPDSIPGGVWLDSRR